MTHRIDRGLERVLGFVGWLFSKPALGVDLGLMAIAFGWVAILIANPAMMDAAAFAMLKKINREAWVAILSMIGLAHAIAMASPWKLRGLRLTALFASGWIWLVVGTTFVPHLTTGAPTYVTIGFGALVTALYVSRLRE